MMRHPPGQERPAPADNPHHPRLDQLQMLPEQARMNRKEIHPLLGLLFDNLQNRIIIDLVHRPPDNHLVNRYRPERRRAIRQQPAADLIQSPRRPARTQIHNRIRPRLQRHPHLLDFIIQRRPHRRQPDIGVNLGRDAPPDRTGLQAMLHMNRIGRNHRPPRRQFIPQHRRIHALILSRPHNQIRQLPLPRQL